MSACQSGFEHIGCIQCALNSTCTNQCMQLVDEEHILSRTLFDFPNDRFETIFKFTAEFRASK